jgi:hypothetical protein
MYDAPVAGTIIGDSRGRCRGFIGWRRRIKQSGRFLFDHLDGIKDAPHPWLLQVG